jgi:hypothetical protein
MCTLIVPLIACLRAALMSLVPPENRIGLFLWDLSGRRDNRIGLCLPKTPSGLWGISASSCHEPHPLKKWSLRQFRDGSVIATHIIKNDLCFPWKQLCCVRLATMPAAFFKGFVE